MNNLNLLTIIVEESLASSIEKEIMSLGAKGFTASEVSGKGLRIYVIINGKVKTLK